jgi:hypothetical protein
MRDTPRTDLLELRYKAPNQKDDAPTWNEISALYEHARKLERDLAAMRAERNWLRGGVYGAADIMDSAASCAAETGHELTSRSFRSAAARIRAVARIRASARIQSDMARGMDMVEKAMDTKDEAGK